MKSLLRTVKKRLSQSEITTNTEHNNTHNTTNNTNTTHHVPHSAPSPPPEPSSNGTATPPLIPLATSATTTAAISTHSSSPNAFTAPPTIVGSMALASTGAPVPTAPMPRHRLSRHIPHDVLVANLPPLRDSAPAQRKTLLLRKLRLCSYTAFNWNNGAQTNALNMGEDAGNTVMSTATSSPTSNNGNNGNNGNNTTNNNIANEHKDKELKRVTLLELVNYLTVCKPSFNEEELAAIIDTIAINLFRPLPPSTYELTGVYNPEEDEPQQEAAWSHIQIVYEFLLRVATMTDNDTRIMDKAFSRKFILNLLELFDSEDPRERDYLKTILHRIYGNCMSLRPFIRRAINNVFYRFIYETDRHHGIAELLEILGSIINGFALPLKEQHKQFLQRVLLPLHKTTHLNLFHPQLSYCVTQFLEKDQTLAPIIIHSILKQWPLTSSKKELMYLNELEEILDRIQVTNLLHTFLPLFHQIGKCIMSPHFQVSERAIYVLNNDILVRFVSTHKDTALPVLARALMSNVGVDETSINEMKLELDQQMSVEMNRNHQNAAMSGGGSAGDASSADNHMHIDSGDSAVATSASSSSSMISADEDHRALLAAMNAELSGYSLHGTDPTHHRSGHWNATIVELTNDLIKLFQEMDGAVMAAASQQLKHSMERKLQRIRLLRQWDALRRNQVKWESEHRQNSANADTSQRLFSQSRTARVTAGGGNSESLAVEDIDDMQERVGMETDGGGGITGSSSSGSGSSGHSSNNSSSLSSLSAISLSSNVDTAMATETETLTSTKRRTQQPPHDNQMSGTTQDDAELT